MPSSPKKLDWKVRMDVPALALKEQERREATMRAVFRAQARNRRRCAVPLARLESVEQSRVVDGCARRGWKIRKLVSPNVRGWPDLFVMDPRTNRCAFVEMKVKNRSRPPSEAQLATLKMLRDCGLNAFIAWSAAEALKKLEEIFHA